MAGFVGKKWLCLWLLSMILVFETNAAPSGCTLTKGLYECDYQTISTPLDGSAFTNPPAQRLRITNINGAITSAIFNANFASLDSSQFDINWAPTLEMKCSGNGSTTTFSQNTFTNMDYIQDFKIINCFGLTVGTSTFEYLGTLDRFVIENGTISSIDVSALANVDITKNKTADYPVPTGELIMMNSRVVGTLAQGFFRLQANLESVTLEGLDLTTVSSSMFTGLTKLRYISLGYNSFTELPSDLFDGLDSLAELHLYDTQLECDCAKLWIYGHSENTKMKIFGDVTCSSPADWQNKRAASYYYSSCVEEEVACKGLMLMGACITYFELGMYIMCVVAFILAGVVLGLVIHTKRQMGGGSGKGKRKPGAKGGKKPSGSRRPPPKGAKKGWA